jgi:hypothetical protein
MKVFTISEETNIQSIENVDNINIFLQYFVHPDKARQQEIEKCLQFNVNNPYINNIYLLNERIYTEKELGITSNKIIQVDIQHRLQFKEIFEYIYVNGIKGYNIIINSDIFFDETVKNLFKSDIHLNKKMYALLRYEYIDSSTEPLLFGDRGDSQDTWIIHSNFTFGKKEYNTFNFEFGKPGCDNKIIYLMSTLGFEILNDPEFIKTYHIHNSNVRNYTNANRINPPYEMVIPKKSFERMQINEPNKSKCYDEKHNHKKSFCILYEYINKKINSNQNFIIPRVATVETDYAIYSMLLNSSQPFQKEITDQFPTLTKFLDERKGILKNNAGIKVTTNESIQKYSTLYLEAFTNCEIYSSWAPFDCVYQGCHFSHSILDNIFQTKKTIYSEVWDVYHTIYTTPWTFALKGKRILIVSNFAESIESKIQTRKEIYGIDLFPNCEIITIKPPQTQGSEKSDEFDVELDRFTKKLDKIKDTYDIALVSCGGYGNLVCSHIYKSGKSSIYVGGVLQMYWGILGNRWFSDRPDIIRLFLNKSWTRPKDSEKPANHKSIENSCYW